MASEVDETYDNDDTKDKNTNPDSTKTIMAYGSIAIGIIGICIFFSPILEIICGVSGLILSIAAKDKNATWFTDAVRRYGSYAAWINIIWVCIELALKLCGIGIFNQWTE
ncbi:MAG: hypothetical protein K2H98_02635 [Duncaniella sp.]|nr:hypothetical protein [Duncaniella sp.]